MSTILLKISPPQFSVDVMRKIFIRFCYTGMHQFELMSHKPEQTLAPPDNSGPQKVVRPENGTYFAEAAVIYHISSFEDGPRRRVSHLILGSVGLKGANMGMFKL